MNFEVSENGYDENGVMTMEEEETPHKYASNQPTHAYTPEQRSVSNAGIYVAIICFILAIVVLFVFR